MPIVNDTMEYALNDHKDFNVGFNAQVRANLNVEILNECESSCAGCYVNKTGNNIDNNDYSRFISMIKLFRENGIEFDTLRLGPTDLFGNDSILDMLDNEDFQYIIRNVKTIAGNGTLSSDPEKIEKIIKKFNSIKGKDEELMWDFQVIFEDDIISDIAKKNTLMSRIQQFLNMIDEPVNYYLIRNISMNDDFNIAKYSVFIEKEFNTILEAVPSFQRSNSKLVHHKTISNWKSNISKYFTDFNETSMTIVDSNQGGTTELNYTFCNGNFFITPFTYDATTIIKDKFKIQDTSNIQDWIGIIADIYVSQTEYVDKTNECGICEFKEVCLDKMVLSYMEEYNFVDCIFPKDILQQFKTIGEQ